MRPVLLLLLPGLLSAAPKVPEVLVVTDVTTCPNRSVRPAFAPEKWAIISPP